MKAFLALHNSPMSIEPVRVVEIEPGQRVADYLRANCPSYDPADEHQPVLLHLNGKRLEPTDWAGITLVPGDVLDARPLPQGPVLLTILIVAATVALTLLLIDIPENDLQDIQEASPTYSSDLQVNRARLGAPIPDRYGRRRFAPDIAHDRYREYEGNDEYWYLLLAIGQGSYQIHDVLIGQTPIANFEDATWQFYEPGQQVTLFPTAVYSAAEVAGQGIVLFGPNEEDYGGQSGPFAACAPGSEVETIALDFDLPQGLAYSNDDGGLDSRSVHVVFQYRAIDYDGAPTGAGTWTTLLSKTYTRATIDPLRITEKISVTPGRYEVRGARTNNSSGSHREKDEIRWTGLRSYLPSNDTYQHTTLAIRIRSSAQLSAQSERRVQVECTRMLPVWNGSAWLPEAPTRNPGWAFCNALKSEYGGDYTDANLILDEIRTFALGCDARGDYFDGAFDTKGTLWANLQQILSSARAVPVLIGSRFTAVRDEPGTGEIYHFSARHIVRDSATLRYKTLDQWGDDSVELEYTDPNTWKPAHITAAIPGSTATKPQKVKMPWITNALQAHREAMFMAAKQAWRTRFIDFKCELEGRLLRPLAKLLVVQEFIEWGQSGDVLRVAGQVLTLSVPVQFVADQDHYIWLRDRRGRSSESFLVTRVTGAPDKVQATGTLPNWIYTDGVDCERTAFAFGAVDAQPKRMLLERGSPSGETQFALTAVLDDPRVYQYDAMINAGTIITPDPAPPQVPVDLTIRAVRITHGGTITAPVLRVVWNPVHDADRYFVEISTDNGTSWQRKYSGVEPWAEIAVPVGAILLRIAAQSEVIGAWYQVAIEVGAGFDIPDTPTGLQLSSAFTGETAEFQWQTDITAVSWWVEVVDPGTASVRIAREVTVPFFVLGVDEALLNGLRREFTLRVYGVNTHNVRSVMPASLTVKNNQMPAVSGIIIVMNLRALQVRFTRPTEPDYAGFRVYLGTTPGFNTETAPVFEQYDPQSHHMTIPIDALGTYYLRIAAFDVWGRDELTLSVEATDVAAGIRNSDLAADLSARINLIDTPVTGLIDRLTQETLDRVNAINAEAITRANAVAAEAAARNTAISAEALARGTAISAEASARAIAISNEVNARIASDSALQDQIDEIVFNEGGTESSISGILQRLNTVGGSVNTLEAFYLDYTNLSLAVNHGTTGLVATRTALTTLVNRINSVNGAGRTVEQFWSDFNSLNLTVTDAGTGLNATRVSMNTLTNRINSVNGAGRTVEQFWSDFNTLNLTVTDGSTGLSATRTSVNTLVNRVNSVNGAGRTVEQFWSDFNTLNLSVIDGSTGLNATRTSLNTVVNRVNSVNGAGRTVEQFWTDFNTLNLSVTNGTTGLTATLTKAQSVENRVNNIDGEFGTLEQFYSDFVNFQGEVNSAGGNATAAYNKAVSVENRINAVDGNTLTIENLFSDHSALSASVNHGTTGLAATRTNLATLINRVNSVNGAGRTVEQFWSDFNSLNLTVTDAGTGLNATRVSMNTLTNRINSVNGAGRTVEQFWSDFNTLNLTVTDGSTGLSATRTSLNTLINRTNSVNGAGRTVEQFWSDFNTLNLSVIDGSTGLSATRTSLNTLTNRANSVNGAGQTLEQFWGAFNTLSLAVNNATTGLTAAYTQAQSAGTRLNTGFAGSTYEAFVSEYTGLRAAVNHSTTGLAALNTLVNRKVQVFWQGTAPVHNPPTVVLETDDIWFNTNDGNHAWRWNGTAWVDAQDSAIADALQDAANAASDAAGAQLTADLKAQMFFRATAPSQFSELLGIGDMWFDTDDGYKPYRWSGTAWLVVPIATTASVTAQIQDNNTATIGYCVIGGNPNGTYTTPASCAAAGGSWVPAAPLAQAVRQVSVTTAEGTATVEQLFQSHADELGLLNLEYMVKLDNDGYVVGFGLKNDGVTSQAIFHVDEFAIGKPGNTIYPFIVATNGLVTINSAYIPSLDVDVLTGDLSDFVASNIGTATINWLQVTGDAYSTNYTTPGQGGWKLWRSGHAEFDSIAIYDPDGRLAFATGQNYLVAVDDAPELANILPNPDFSDTLDIYRAEHFAVHVNSSSTTYLTTDATYITNGCRVHPDGYLLGSNTGTTTGYYVLHSSAMRVTEGESLALNLEFYTEGELSSHGMYLNAYFSTGEPPDPEQDVFIRSGVSNPPANSVALSQQVQVDFEQGSNVDDGLPHSLSGNVTVPAGAKWCSLQYYFQKTSGMDGVIVTKAEIKRLRAMVGTTYIRDAAITSAKIQDAAITNAKIGTAAVDTLEIMGGAVTAVHALSPADGVGSFAYQLASIPFNHGWSETIPVLVQSSGSLSHSRTSDTNASDGYIDQWITLNQAWNGTRLASAIHSGSSAVTLQTSLNVGCIIDIPPGTHNINLFVRGRTNSGSHDGISWTDVVFYAMGVKR